MTAIPDGALVPWYWLLSCKTCGEPHEWRYRSLPYSGKTWAAKDGHIYMPHLSPSVVERLYEEWRRS